MWAYETASLSHIRPSDWSRAIPTYPLANLPRRLTREEFASLGMDEARLRRISARIDRGEAIVGADADCAREFIVRAARLMASSRLSRPATPYSTWSGDGGSIRVSPAPSENRSELRKTAMHEAVHAFIAVWHGIVIRRVSIEPAPGELGRCVLGYESVPETFRAAVSLAAVVWEEEHGDRRTARVDLETAREILATRPWVKLSEAKATIRACLRQNRARIEALADRLMAVRTVSGDDALQILSAGK